ncbi:MAG: hypothetical protein ACI9QD_000507 [Thermoproteota archaeon]|jgi:hypothetical protein
MKNIGMKSLSIIITLVTLTGVSSCSSKKSNKNLLKNLANGDAKSSGVLYKRAFKKNNNSNPMIIGYKSFNFWMTMEAVTKMAEKIGYSQMKYEEMNLSDAHAKFLTYHMGPELAGKKRKITFMFGNNLLLSSTITIDDTENIKRTKLVYKDLKKSLTKKYVLSGKMDEKYLENSASKSRKSVFSKIFFASNQISLEFYIVKGATKIDLNYNAAQEEKNSVYFLPAIVNTTNEI